MRVIKKSLDHLSWWAGRKVPCYNCNSELELEASDRPTDHVLKGQTSEHFHIACVVCGCDITVSRVGPYFEHSQ